MSAPVSADGLNYTTLGSENRKLSPRTLQMRSLKNEDESAVEEPDAQKDAAMTEVWNRYKALSQGHKPAPSSTTKSGQNGPAHITPPKSTETSQKQESGTRKPGIIGQYQEHKRQRSQMRVLQIRKPDSSGAE